MLVVVMMMVMMAMMLLMRMLTIQAMGGDHPEHGHDHAHDHEHTANPLFCHGSTQPPSHRDQHQ